MEYRNQMLSIIFEHLLHVGVVLSFMGELRSHGINNDTTFSAKFISRGRGKERCFGVDGTRGVVRERRNEHS